MRRTLYALAIVLILADIFLAAGLYQPFDTVEIHATVESSAGPFIIMRTPSGTILQPAPPFPTHTGDKVTLSCHLGRWIPILLDCQNTITPIQPERNPRNAT